MLEPRWLLSTMTSPVGVSPVTPAAVDSMALPVSATVPDAPSDTIQGTLEPSTDATLLEIPGTAETASISLDLSGGPDLPTSITVYNPIGQAIYQAPMPAAGNGVTIDLQNLPTAPSVGVLADLFLKFTVGSLAPSTVNARASSGTIVFGSPPTGAGPATPPFFLEVKQVALVPPSNPFTPVNFVAAPPNRGIWVSPGLSTSPNPSIVGPFAAPTAPEFESENAGGSRPTTSSTPVLAPAPAARFVTGPLPSLSAAALGGVVGAAFDRTPVVSIDDTLVLELTVDNPPPQSDLVGSARPADAPNAKVEAEGAGRSPRFGRFSLARDHARAANPCESIGRDGE